MTLRTNISEARDAGNGAASAAVRAAVKPMMMAITTSIAGPGRTRAT